MKTILILLYLTIHITGTLWAQEERHIFHYPLNLGDRWEYLRSPGFLDARKVIGDTLLPDGKTYRVIERVTTGGTSFFFQRVSDSNEVFQRGRFDSDEFLLFKLAIKVGDTWTFPLRGNPTDSAFSKVFELSDTTVFSSRFKFAQIESFTLPDSAPLFFGTEVILVDSIGIFFEGFEGGKNELQGAIINGRQYGNIILAKQDSIKAFYPLHVGDYWEYAIGLPNASIRTWRQVIKDTLMDNGNTYSVIISDDNYHREFADTVYERVTDGFEVRRYFSNTKGSGEQLLFKLDAEMGDSWISSDSIFTNQVKLDTVFSADFLNKVRIHKSFQTTYTGFEILAHELGFIRSRNEFAGIPLFLEGAIINGTMYGNVTSVNSKEETPTISDFSLLQNYPNPFNGRTTITFELANVFPEQVDLAVYNLLGQKIITLIDEILPAGQYSIFWNAADRKGKLVASNMYIIRLTIGSTTSIRQVTLIK